MAAAGAIAIEPIRAEHVESFHRALDTVSRERKYLSFLRRRRSILSAPSFST